MHTQYNLNTCLDQEIHFTFSATDKGDALVFASASDGTNPNIMTLGFGSGDGDVTTTGTQTLSNKTFNSSKN